MFAQYRFVRLFATLIWVLMMWALLFVSLELPGQVKAGFLAPSGLTSGVESDAILASQALTVPNNLVEDVSDILNSTPIFTPTDIIEGSLPGTEEQVPPEGEVPPEGAPEGEVPPESAPEGEVPPNSAEEGVPSTEEGQVPPEGEVPPESAPEGQVPPEGAEEGAASTEEGQVPPEGAEEGVPSTEEGQVPPEGAEEGASEGEGAAEEAQERDDVAVFTPVDPNESPSDSEGEPPASEDGQNSESAAEATPEGAEEGTPEGEQSAEEGTPEGEQSAEEGTPEGEQSAEEGTPEGEQSAEEGAPEGEGSAEEGAPEGEGSADEGTPEGETSAEEAQERDDVGVFTPVEPKESPSDSQEEASASEEGQNPESSGQPQEIAPTPTLPISPTEVITDSQGVEMPGQPQEITPTPTAPISVTEAITDSQAVEMPGQPQEIAPTPTAPISVTEAITDVEEVEIFIPTPPITVTEAITDVEAVEILTPTAPISVTEAITDVEAVEILTPTAPISVTEVITDVEAVEILTPTAPISVTEAITDIEGLEILTPTLPISVTEAITDIEGLEILTPTVPISVTEAITDIEGLEIPGQPQGIAPTSTVAITVTEAITDIEVITSETLVAPTNIACLPFAEPSITEYNGQKINGPYVNHPHQTVITWKDESSSETGYRVERQIGAGEWQVIANLAPDAMLHSDVNLEASDPDEPIRYRVRPLQGEALGPESRSCSKPLFVDSFAGHFRVFYRVEACPPISDAVGEGRTVCVPDVETARRIGRNLEMDRFSIMQLGLQDPVGNPPMAIDLFPCDRVGCARVNQGRAIMLSPDFMPPYNPGDQFGQSSLWGPAHKLLEHVQGNYSKNDDEPSWVTDGQIRAIGHKLCVQYTADFSACTLTLGQLSDTNYNREANGFLSNPSQSLPETSYQSALFWSYLSEHYGISAASQAQGDLLTPPGVAMGTDSPLTDTNSSSAADLDNAFGYQLAGDFAFMRLFWGTARGNPSANGITLVNQTLAQLGYQQDFREVFREFGVTNYVKNMSNAPAKYKYFKGGPAGVSLSLQGVPLSANELLTSGETFTTTSDVPSWGTRYFRFKLDPGVKNIEVRSQTAAQNDVYYTLLAISENSWRGEVKWAGPSFLKTLRNENFKEVILVVSGLEEAAGFGLSLKASTPSSPPPTVLPNPNRNSVDDPAKAYEAAFFAVDTRLRADSPYFITSDIAGSETRYYRFRPDAAIESLNFDSHTLSYETIGYTVLGIKEGEIVNRINYRGPSFVRRLENEQFDEVVLVVSGVGEDAKFDLSINDYQPEALPQPKSIVSGSGLRGMHFYTPFLNRYSQHVGLGGGKVTVVDNLLDTISLRPSFRRAFKTYALTRYSISRTPLLMTRDIRLTNGQRFTIQSNVLTWAGRYFRFQPSATVKGLKIETHTTSESEVYVALLAVKGGRVVKQIDNTGPDFVETLANNSYDELILLVAGLNQETNFNLSVEATQTVPRASESGRSSTESGRSATESGRSTTESGRTTTESGRSTTDSGRSSSESASSTTENGRNTTEAARNTAKWKGTANEWKQTASQWELAAKEWKRAATELQQTESPFQRIAGQLERSASTSTRIATQWESLATRWEGLATQLERTPTQWERAATQWQRAAAQWERTANEWKRIATEPQPIAREPVSRPSESYWTPSPPPRRAIESERLLSESYWTPSPPPRRAIESEQLVTEWEWTPSPPAFRPIEWEQLVTEWDWITSEFDSSATESTTTASETDLIASETDLSATQPTRSASEFNAGATESDWAATKVTRTTSESDWAPTKPKRKSAKPTRTTSESDWAPTKPKGTTSQSDWAPTRAKPTETARRANEPDLAPTKPQYTTSESDWAPTIAKQIVSNAQYSAPPEDWIATRANPITTESELIGVELDLSVSESNLRVTEPTQNTTQPEDTQPETTTLNIDKQRCLTIGVDTTLCEPQFQQNSPRQTNTTRPISGAAKSYPFR